MDRSQSITPQTGKKLNTVIFAVRVLALGYFAYDKFVLAPITIGVPGQMTFQRRVGNMDNGDEDWYELTLRAGDWRWRSAYAV